jgi:hypothetical protein
MVRFVDHNLFSTPFLEQVYGLAEITANIQKLFPYNQRPYKFSQRAQSKEMRTLQLAAILRRI